MRTTDLDLRPLYYFVRVLERGSLSKASATLSVGQPVLSREIKRLEARYGVKLLYRNGRGVTPTLAGEILLIHAEALLRGLTLIENELDTRRDTLAGSVSIAVPPMFGRALNFTLIREFQATHPEVLLKFTEGFTTDFLDWLAHGSVDLAIIYNPPNITTLIAEHLVDDRLCLIGAPRSIDRERGSEIPFSALNGLSMVLAPKPHRLRALIDGGAKEAGITLKMEVEVTGTATMLDLVRGGIGYTIFPETLVREEALAGTIDLWPLGAPRITPRLFMVTSTTRPMTPALLSVLAAIRQHFAKKVVTGGM